MRYGKFTRRINKKRDKYSVEHTAVSFSTGDTLVNGAYQGAQLVVSPTDTQGMRKVKHLTLSLSLVSGTGSTVLYWALVYVPQGYNPNTLNVLTSNSFYEPNQNVMGCGLIDPDAGPIRIRSPLSRNLNSGDSIYLVVGTNLAQAGIRGVVNYAITLQ